MRRLHSIDGLGVWVIALASLVAGQAAAQPRMASGNATLEAVETPPTDVWLQRLPGRYILDGVIHHQEMVDFDPREDYPDGEVMSVTHILNEWAQPIVGKGDCIEFADAPGLQCVINLLWPEMWDMQTGRASLGAVSDLSPAMVLAGVNPSDQSIRFLMVDKRGLGHPGSLVLKGESAMAKVPCVNLPGVQRCQQKLRIEARADARIKYVVLSTEVRYLRSKLDRKQFLQEVVICGVAGSGGEGSGGGGAGFEDSGGGGSGGGSAGCDSRLERSHEWLDELLEVSFSLRREERPEDGAPAAPAVPDSVTESTPSPAPSDRAL